MSDGQGVITVELPAVESLSGATRVLAPMPGLVTIFEKQIGDLVNEGDVILILEAMKMENLIMAPSSGRIAHLPCKEGQRVSKGSVLALIS